MKRSERILMVAVLATNLTVAYLLINKSEAKQLLFGSQQVETSGTTTSKGPVPAPPSKP